MMEMNIPPQETLKKNMMENEDFERFESRRNSLLTIDDYERIVETVLSLILSRLIDSTHMAQYSS